MLADFPGMGDRRSFAAEARDVALFGACYLALDWASSIYPVGLFNIITPWNPPPALSIVWMLLGGLRYAPVVFAAILTGDLLFHEAPGGVWLSIITSLVLAVGYTGIAAALRLRFQFDGRLHEMQKLWIFVATTAVGAAIIGTCYVAVLWVAKIPFGGSFFVGVFQFWLGDTVGILVTAPLLMVAADPEGRQRVIQSWRKPETVLQFITLIGLIFFVFYRGTTPTQHFYLLFLPLIWIAVRNGLGGAVVASGVVQAGVLLSTQDGFLQGLSIIEVQARVTALTITGLALGIIVDERMRAIEELKRSLRLAAASEMAGAIAHEINQPLAAMQNYGSACRILLNRDKEAVSLPELGGIVDNMLRESKRAAEVVRRLRDLFRRGTVQLEPVKVSILLERARAIGNELNRAGDVTFKVDNSEGEQTLLVDRVQIELVLRNLIANAFEAVSGMPEANREVTVLARKQPGGRIMFRVADSGEGMTQSMRQRLFEPLASSKTMGMGLGLAISRTIAEAHGGTLNVSGMGHGQFDLTLPIEAGDE